MSMQSLLRTKSPTPEHTQTGLSRSLGVFSLTMLGVGATIGTGIFFTMAEAVPKAGPAVLLAFLLAAITAGLTALCYAELSAAVPGSGSAYSFSYATLGEFPAFMVAACLMLEYALAGSATAIGWSAYLNNFLSNAFGISIPEALRSPMLVAGKEGLEIHAGHFNLPPVILVVICAILLLRGVKESTVANNVMVIIKLAVLAFFVAVAFTGFKADHFTPFFTAAGMAGVTAAAGTVFFSFIGLDTVATAGSESKNPQRDLPRGILLALIIVTVAYMLVAVTALGAQAADKFAGQEAGLSVILQNVTGKTWPAIVLSLGAVISVFSITLVSIYGQTRILYAVSRDGLIPSSFHAVSERTRTPVSNTLIVSVLVAIVAGLVDSGYLWDMVSMGTLVAFMFVSASVPVLRARQRGVVPAGFRLPFGPYVVPGLSVFACLYIISDLSAATYRVFAIWMALAVVAYFLYSRRHSALAASDSSKP